MSYPDFQSVDDFLGNDRFRAWVKGECPDDKLLWQNWMALNPERIQLYEMAVATFLMIEGDTDDISQNYVNDKVQSIMSRVEETPVTRTVALTSYWKWLAAAVVIIALGMGWLNWKKNLSDQDIVSHVQSGVPAETWQFQSNEKKEPLLINLPDGSSVLLSMGSRVRYKNVMDSARRELYLEGEGFFEISKNPDRPFFVYTNGLTTKVLGTSFNVRAFDKESEVSVAVKTGKVMVMSGSGKQPSGSERTFTLLPNEAISLNKENEKYVKKGLASKSASTEMPQIQKPRFEFRFTPISEVFAELEKTYHVVIEYDKQKMRNCTLTATLTDEPFIDKLRLICIGTESTFEIQNNKITIHSKGCP